MGSSLKPEEHSPEGEIVSSLARIGSGAEVEEVEGVEQMEQVEEVEEVEKAVEANEAEEADKVDGHKDRRRVRQVLASVCPGACLQS